MNTTKLHQDAILKLRRKHRAELLARDESLSFWRGKSADQHRQIRDLKACLVVAVIAMLVLGVGLVLK